MKLNIVLAGLLIFGISFGAVATESNQLEFASELLAKQSDSYMIKDVSGSIITVVIENTMGVKATCLKLQESGINVAKVTNYSTVNGSLRRTFAKCK